MKVRHPDIIKLKSSKFKKFNINIVLAQLMHIDLNHALCSPELNTIEKSNDYCKKKVGGCKECDFEAT